MCGANLREIVERWPCEREFMTCALLVLMSTYTPSLLPSDWLVSSNDFLHRQSPSHWFAEASALAVYPLAMFQMPIFLDAHLSRLCPRVGLFRVESILLHNITLILAAQDAPLQSIH